MPRRALSEMPVVSRRPSHAREAYHDDAHAFFRPGTRFQRHEHADGTGDRERARVLAGAAAVLAQLAHDPEEACPGRDPGRGQFPARSRATVKITRNNQTSIARCASEPNWRHHITIACCLAGARATTHMPGREEQERIMPQQITTGYKALLEAAEREIETLSVDEARKLHGRGDVTFVDLRDPREREREGKLPGAFHCTRGMLEFWIDPASPYHKPQFAEDKKFVFFCAGGWRSALAAQTAQQMGLKPVAHIEGGFGEWKKSGAPVEAPEPKKT